jgi:nitroreductase
MYEDVLAFFTRRRSIRAYQDRPVEQEKIDVLLKAAMAAPSACNCQPWEFVVVTDPAVLTQLRDGLIMGRYTVPCAIAVCGNTKLAKGVQSTLVHDCCAAMENMILAATALGLGSVWICGIDPSPRKAITEALNLPEYVEPVALAYIGYAAEDKPPRTQYNEKRIYQNVYDPQRKHRTRPKNMKYL